MSTGTPNLEITMQQNTQVLRVLVSLFRAEEVVTLHSVPGNITSDGTTSSDLALWKPSGTVHEPAQNK